MKAAGELNDKEFETYANMHKELKEKTAGMKFSEYFDDYSRSSGYAHYTFRGKVSKALIDRLGRMPSSSEVIMLVDGGFSHFGASCGITTAGGL